LKISVEKAATVLKAGDIVAIPTETVYGLAALASDKKAVAKIFAKKGRPCSNPLIIHLAKALDIIAYVEELPQLFFVLTKAFWPGPLTLVLPIIESKIDPSIRANLKTAAFRVPDHPLARQVLNLAGPLVMPSSNPSGSPSATAAVHVEDDFGVNFPVLDGGDCLLGLESTILYLDENECWKIIRQGAISQSALANVLGYTPEIEILNKNQQTPLCPGQLFRHYAPKARLHLIEKFNVEKFNLNEQLVIIGFEDRKYPDNSRLYSLGKSNDDKMAATRLYSVLRKLDTDDVKIAHVDINFQDHGLWKTIKERLIKASQP